MIAAAVFVSRVFVLMCCLLGGGLAWAGEPPKVPILRIETGMHTARITRISTDTENKYLVTGSDDKTVRVWEIATGKLLKILRPPIGEGDEGKIDSVAISPDGQTVACGGWTGYEWDRSNSIYLFDFESGRLAGRIMGNPSVINHLAFSRNGRYLAASLGGESGIRVYQIDRAYGRINSKLAAEDKDYGSDSYGVDFDPNGRLGATSFDGFVRLYDRDFKLIAKKKAPGGNYPYSISFSPDGNEIAVGFNDSTRVDILSGQDLAHRLSPNTPEAGEQILASVTWSMDGRLLYAGGTVSDKSGNLIIRKWSDSGRGSYVDPAATQDIIMSIVPLKSGGIAFGAGAPAFGIFDRNGNKTIYREPAIADYRGVLDKFLLAADGAAVQFGYEEWGKSPARFSISARLLQPDPERDGNLIPSLTSADGLNVTDWKNTVSPKLNGKPLQLQQYEISRSLAISPDRNAFLLGTDWYLPLFDREGNQKWEVPTPGAVWGVNISGNGKVAAAAFGDGTIRWYRLRDGKALLALFPHKDKKRWVIWTPKGYYDASPGAEELIGWHVNNGADQAADFFPASRFRSTYYRPDVISKVLETVDEDEALRLVNQEAGRRQQEASVEKMLPPVVRIVSPTNGTEVSGAEVNVSFTVRSPSGEPVTGVKALVDGRPVATERGLKLVGKDSETRELRVTVPERDAEISIIAENRYAASEPATVRVRWRGEVKREEFQVLPKLYVLAVGVSDYKDKDLPLKFAAKDAKDFAEAMLRQKGKLYRDVAVKVLTDAGAIKDDIMDALDWITKETTSKDVAMVFLAGHGVNDSAGIYYYLPSNADTERLRRTGVAFSDIKNTLASLAGKTILFVDTCHSGNVMGTRRGVADINAVVNELSSAENGAVVFASSTGRQYSLEDPAWGNGAFTKAVVEGVGGKADYQGKGRITINMLDLYISERVKELTGGKQTPTTTKPQTIPDFPIAVRLGN